MPEDRHKRYRVYENNDILLETDDKEEARKVWKQSHREHISERHEIHEWWDGQYNGICQLAPFDCPECGRQPETCKCRAVNSGGVM